MENDCSKDLHSLHHLKERASFKQKNEKSKETKAGIV
jgi:hypothetical protein